MRIGIIQATSQRDRNRALEECTLNALLHNGLKDPLTNYGVFPNDGRSFSYIETAVCVSLLLSSGAEDLIVTGCSSGQGMMLACNSLPGVICGYIPTPQDAFLFGRINDGNAVSLPLGLNFGWMGEINLQCTLDQLFAGPFGCGYPPEEAERKKRDTDMLKTVNQMTKRTWKDIFDRLDPELTGKALQWEKVVEDILKYGTEREIVSMIAKRQEMNR